MSVAIRVLTLGVYGGRSRVAAPGELRRTCNRCGNRWYVPKADTKPPRKHRWIGNPRGLKLQSAIGGSQRAGAELRLARYADEQARYDQARRCPGCGSSSFAEKPV